MTPERLLLDHLPWIERVAAATCRQHRMRTEEAEEFAARVRLKLVEDDYAVLRKFQGRSSLTTYLTAVVSHLFLDYRNHLWGKWRPSAEARRRGPLAVELETLLARDGLTLDEACQRLAAVHKIELQREQAAELARTLPVRTRRRMEGEDALADQPAPDPSPEEAALEAERDAARQRLTAALAAALARLPAEDRLIVQLRNEEGLALAEIARLLDLPAKPLYRRLEGILRNLRRALEAEGIGGPDVAEAFAGAFGSAWNGAPARESRRADPSHVVEAV